MAKRHHVISQDQRAFDWVSQELGTHPYDPTRCIAVSHLQENEDGSIDALAVVVLDNFTQFACEASIASDGSSRWATRGFFRAVYDYVFETRGKARMNMLVEPSNTAAIAMHEKLGHVREATLRDWFGTGKDAILFSFTKADYESSRWHKSRDVQANK